MNHIKTQKETFSFNQFVLELHTCEALYISMLQILSHCVD